MLVLSRKQNERIHIGENVVITVVRINGNTVRIGVEAPGDIGVLRGELVPATPNPSTRTLPLPKAS